MGKNIKELALDFMILLNVLVLPLMLPEMGWMKICFEKFNLSNPLISWLVLMVPAYLYFKVAMLLLPKLLLLIFPKRFSDLELEVRYGTFTNRQATILTCLLVGVGLIITF